MIRSMLAFVLVLLTGAITSPAPAVMIVTGSGTGNTDAGGDATFEKVFSNLDITGNGGAVYIGNGSALRTKHAGYWSGVPLFGSQIKKQHRLHQLDDTEALTDIVLIELQSDPGLPSLVIAENPPVDGTLVRMIGFGANREPDVTHWNVTGDYPNNSPPDVTWTWSETPSRGQAELSGFLPLVSTGNQRFGDLRWGTNIVDTLFETVTFDFDVGDNNGILHAFVMDFDRRGGTTHEAQAVGHDSGGMVVAWNQDTSQWELLGLMHANIGYPNQPGSGFSAVFGNLTVASDLSSYRDQIIPFIPEPTLTAVLLMTLPLLKWRKQECCIPALAQHAVED